MAVKELSDYPYLTSVSIRKRPFKHFGPSGECSCFNHIVEKVMYISRFQFLIKRLVLIYNEGQNWSTTRVHVYECRFEANELLEKQCKQNNCLLFIEN